ncbi:hypothetical protein IO382_001557, partial [Campylobacter lari]|nr:hypothetical protein [Campylobacter lari]
LNPGSFAENKTNNITALNSVSIAASMSAFEDGDYEFVGVDDFTLTNYTDNNNKVTENKVQKIDFKQYLTIDSVDEWAIFANAWNKNLGDTRRVGEFRLIKDINFINNFKPEYMIGHVYYDSANKKYIWDNAFTSTFNGNGYTLSNIFLDLSSYSNPYKDYYVGIFSGVGKNGVVKNLKVENIGMKGYRATGSIAGGSNGGSFYDISMKNITDIYAENNYAGGFIGLITGVDVGNYERISIDGLNSVYAGSTGYSLAGAGGFAGAISAGVFKDISINNVGSIFGAYSGGFAGFAGDAKTTAPEIEKMIFENIVLTDFTKIGGWTWTGGFMAKFSKNNINNVSFKNILLKDIDTITAEQGSGGFIARTDGGLYENITLEHIGEISTTRGNDSSGGFIGILEGGEYKNIKINDINLVKFVSQNNGLFAGYITNGKFENIAISNVKQMDIGDVNFFGLFAGYIGDPFDSSKTSYINNIFIHDIGAINYTGHTGGGYGDPYYGNLGVFAENVENAMLKNIYISLEGLTIKDDDKNDLRFKTAFIYNNESDAAFINANVTLDNINIYYDKDLFSAYDNTASDKYTDVVNFKQNAYDNFFNDASTATGVQYDKISSLFKTTTDFKVTDPIFSTISENGEDSIAKLDEDDLLQEMIEKEIINDITNGKYKLYISDLLKMLEDKANYSKMSEDQKVEFVAKYFLDGDKTKALEVVQSLDFLLTYENNGLSTASKDKFEGNGFNTKEDILKQVNNTTKNIKDRINKLEKELESLASNSEQSLEDLINKQSKLDNTIKAYNAYVDLINKGLASKNDPEFIALKNQIDTLMKDSQVLADLINANQKELSAWQNDNNTENFKVIGAFANAILNTNPDLKEITGDGGDGEDLNKPDLPESNMEFEQTASLNLIGDETI